jgi:hypothetical protein
MVGRLFRAIVIIFSPETLESAPPSGKEREGDSFFTWLLKPERLPAPAVSVPPRREPPWKWLLLPEKLAAPAAKEAGRDRPSLFTYLYSSETLPSDPPRSGKADRSSPRKA